MLCVGEFVVGLWGVSVCCVWESSVWVCGSVCDVCGRVCCGFVGIECLLCVGEFCCVFVGVIVCCVWESLLCVCGE